MPSSTKFHLGKIQALGNVLALRGVRAGLERFEYLSCKWGPMDKKHILQLAKEGGEELYKKASSLEQEHYGMVWSDGSYTLHPSRSCFGSFSEHMYRDCNENKRKAEMFFFCHKRYIQNFPTDEDKKGLNTFLDWVMNRSPYADVFISKNPEEIAEDPCFLRTDVQPQQMIGAAVLVRHRHQMPNLIKQWNKFREHMNEDLAFYYAWAYDAGTFQFHWAAKNHGHSLFNTAYIAAERLKNFLLHKVVSANKTVAEGNFTYTDYLSLWDGTQKGSTLKGLVDVDLNSIAHSRLNFFTGKKFALNAFPLNKIDEHITEFFKINKMDMEKYASV